VITGDHLFNPRFVGYHRLSDFVDRHRLMADRAIGAHQIAHRVDDLSIHDIDRGHFNNATLQSTGFRINYSQHFPLQKSPGACQTIGPILSYLAGEFNPGHPGAIAENISFIRQQYRGDITTQFFRLFPVQITLRPAFVKMLTFPRADAQTYDEIFGF
jgi:hypothetical protein